MENGRLALTSGGTSHTFGYRVYDTFETADAQQVVVTHDRQAGRVVAIAVGEQIGALRTGALGGAAARLLVPGSGRVTLGLVGAGLQARTQLWAISSVLDVAKVRIASRTAASRESLAARTRRELQIPVAAVTSAKQAVRSADVVVLATTSHEPVIDSTWLAEDVLVITLGHKQVVRAELGPDLLDGASIVTTDSPEQLRSYDPSSLVAAAGRAGETVDLGLIAAGRVAPVRTGRRVHLSVGPAGTEALLLRQLAEQTP